MIRDIPTCRELIERIMAQAGEAIEHMRALWDDTGA
jgi:hypothetical protein